MISLARSLKHFRIELGLSQSEMAQKLGIPQTTWSGYERGRSNPNLKILLELKKLGFNYRGIAPGAAEQISQTIEHVGNGLKDLQLRPSTMPLMESKLPVLRENDESYVLFRFDKPIPITAPTDDTDPEAMVMIPLYSQFAAAGGGEEPTQAEVIKTYLPIVLELFRGADPRRCGAIRVKGDSMTDVGLYANDIAIFDTSEQDGDGIYVITMNGVTRVKRLENRIIEKKIIISSENAKRYPTPETLSYEQAADMLTIHGKVIAWQHRHIY